jgi:hypothetical protein
MRLSLKSGRAIGVQQGQFAGPKVQIIRVATRAPFGPAAKSPRRTCQALDGFAAERRP